MEMAKEYNVWWRCKKSYAKGVDMLANTVKVTMGPKGRNVILDKNLEHHL